MQINWWELDYNEKKGEQTTGFQWSFMLRVFQSNDFVGLSNEA